MKRHRSGVDFYPSHNVVLRNNSEKMRKWESEVWEFRAHEKNSFDQWMGDEDERSQGKVRTWIVSVESTQ